MTDPIADMLARIHGHIVHKPLAKISPFAVPVMLEVGREPVFGHGQVDEQVVVLAVHVGEQSPVAIARLDVAKSPVLMAGVEVRRVPTAPPRVRRCRAWASCGASSCMPARCPPRRRRLPPRQCRRPRAAPTRTTWRSVTGMSRRT